MEADDFADRGHALNAAITRNVDGSTTWRVFANTPVAILGIIALTGLLLIQELRRPQGPQRAIADGDGERPQDLQLAPPEDDGERSES